MVRTIFSLFFAEDVEKFHVESSPRSDRLGNQGECGQPGRDDPGPGWPSSLYAAIQRIPMIHRCECEARQSSFLHEHSNAFKPYLINCLLEGQFGE